jgi:hypothetical protein
MTNHLKRTKDLEIARAIENNMYVCWKSYFKNDLNYIEYEENDEYFKYTTGIQFPLSNGVLDCKITPKNANEKIREIINSFKIKNLPFLWIVGPFSKPDNLDDILLKNGLIFLSESTGMSLELKNLPTSRYTIPNVEIVKVIDIDLLKVWVGLILTVFEYPKELVFDFLIDAISKTLFGENTTANASSYMKYGGGVAGIYWVGTLEEARRKGIGKIITLMPLYKAKEAGYETAILQSSEIGFNLYKKIGFKEYCKFKMFAWIPGS